MTMTLKEARAQAGLSMADVARALGVGKTIVHDREHGLRGFPTDQLDRFADLCGVPVADLDVPVPDRYPLPDEPAPVMVLPDPGERERDELAERMIPEALNLACVVQDRDKAGVADVIGKLSGGEKDAMLVVLAAMVDTGRGTRDLLAWLDAA